MFAALVTSGWSASASAGEVGLTGYCYDECAGYEGECGDGGQYDESAPCCA